MCLGHIVASVEIVGSGVHERKLGEYYIIVSVIGTQTPYAAIDRCGAKGEHPTVK
jgi:hypothetical protein